MLTRLPLLAIALTLQLCGPVTTQDDAQSTGTDGGDASVTSDVATIDVVEVVANVDVQMGADFALADVPADTGFEVALADTSTADHVSTDAFTDGATTADASADATNTSDAGVVDSAASDTRSTSSDSGDAACAVGAPCVQDSDCCTGVCDNHRYNQYGDSTATHTCQPAMEPYCAPNHAPANTPLNCDSLGSSPWGFERCCPGLECSSHTGGNHWSMCVVPGSCVVYGQPCTAATHCCSGCCFTGPDGINGACGEPSAGGCFR